jgi:hypothetical protein
MSASTGATDREARDQVEPVGGKRHRAGVNALIVGAAMS